MPGRGRVAHPIYCSNPGRFMYDSATRFRLSVKLQRYGYISNASPSEFGPRRRF